MINLSKKEISKKIEDFEYYNNAMKYTGGGIIINSLEIDEEDEIRALKTKLKKEYNKKKGRK